MTTTYKFPSLDHVVLGGQLGDGLGAVGPAEGAVFEVRQHGAGLATRLFPRQLPQDGLKKKVVKKGFKCDSMKI